MGKTNLNALSSILGTARTTDYTVGDFITVGGKTSALDVTSVALVVNKPENFVSVITGSTEYLLAIASVVRLFKYNLDTVVYASSGRTVYVEDVTSILGIPVTPNTAYTIAANVTVREILEKTVPHTNVNVQLTRDKKRFVRTHFGGTLEDDDALHVFAHTENIPLGTQVGTLLGSVVKSNSLERYELHEDLPGSTSTTKVFPSSTLFSSAYNLTIESVEVYAAWYPSDYEGNLGPGTMELLSGVDGAVSVSDDKLTVTINNLSETEYMNAVIVWIF